MGKQNVQAEKVYCLNCVHNCDDHGLLKDNYVTRNVPEEFRDFRETGP